MLELSCASVVTGMKLDCRMARMKTWGLSRYDSLGIVGRCDAQVNDDDYNVVSDSILYLRRRLLRDVG